MVKLYQRKGGLKADMKETVESLVRIGACKLALTHDGQTPADLARFRGHLEVANLLAIHPFDLTLNQKINLLGQLLKIISSAERQKKTGGDQGEVERRLEVVQKVTRLVTMGAPLEPVGGYTVYPLHLAITSNCIDIVPQLLSVGAPLTSTTGRLGILKQAWLSPDVTTSIAVIVTRVCHLVSTE
ncbi:hypothetical protein Pcinc_003236 [Petrolisthes cinctipes]|uniref:Ankyrin repeat protein n=1 Tax=Petrolisthes cinctipes TaxID=88211 RepID=A0AAE1L4V5_PETCI|nr:hypothetical protein Pcinc_003236 [Petrolisthes cinctipes]